MSRALATMRRPCSAATRMAMTLALCWAIVVLTPGPASACSCAGRPLPELAQRADSIGVGKISWIAEGAKETTIAVEFEQVYKGELGSWERVRTAGSSGGCGLEVHSGRRYAFFVDGTHRGVIRASLCGGTTGASTSLEERLAAVTGPPYAPVHVARSLEDEPGGSHWWAWVGAGALLAAAGAAWWSHRRSTGAD